MLEDKERLSDLEQQVYLTKVEIAALRHPKAEEDRLMAASHELSAIVRATEQATNKLLSAAEEIAAAADRIGGATVDPAVAAELKSIRDNVNRIFEAANFQDITGQRIGKVVRTVDFVEARVAAMIDAWGADSFVDLPRPEEVSPDDERHLLNGPQLEGKAISQADIDALFD